MMSNESELFLSRIPKNHNYSSIERERKFSRRFFTFSIKRWNKGNKVEAARVHFLSDVFVAVAVVVALKLPNSKFKQREH